MPQNFHSDVDFNGHKVKNSRLEIATLSGTSVTMDWAAADVFMLSLSGVTTLTDDNLTAGMVKELRIVGNSHLITLPTYWTIVGGGTYDAAGVNVLIITCYDAAPSSEIVEVSIVTR